VRFDAGTEFDRQISTLLTAGYPAVSAMSAAALRDLLEPLREPVLAVAEGGPEPGRMPFLLVPVLPPALTMPLTALAGRPGQVSRLLPDLDRFTPLPDLQVPAAGAYALLGVERGEEFCGRVPTEALAEIAGRGRTPLTVAEGVALVTQFPAALAKNRCFSLGGSRCGDKRVPALWISAGAPMLGWCWAGNPHSWLGVASTGSRIRLHGLPTGNTVWVTDE